MRDFFRKNALIGAAEIFCRLPLIFTAGYLARSVGPGMFGVWALVMVYQGMLAGMAGLGLSSSLSRLASVGSEGKAHGYLFYALRVCGSAIFLAGAVTLLLKHWFGGLLGIQPEFRWLLGIAVLLAAGVVADGLLDAYFKARERVSRQVGYILVRTLVEIVAVFLTFYVHIFNPATADVQLAVYGGCVLALKLLIYPWLVASGPDGWRDDLPDRGERRSFLRYGVPMIPAVLVIWFTGQGDRLILGHLLDKHTLGVYAFGASLAAYLVFLGYAVYPLLLPRASRLYEEGDTVGLNVLFKGSQQIFLVLLTGALLFIALFNQEIIAWTAGSRFSGAGRIMLVLAFAVGVEQMLGIYQYVFHLVKQTRWIFWFNSLYAMVLVTSVWVAGNVGGVAWVPWGVLGATLFCNGIRYAIAHRYIAISQTRSLLYGLGGVLFAAWGLAEVTDGTSLGVRSTLAAILVPVMAIAARSIWAGQKESYSPRYVADVEQ